MDRILKILKKENGPRASSAPALELNTILFKHVYWYMQQISGERLQDHWSSGFRMSGNLIIDGQSRNSMASRFTIYSNKQISYIVYKLSSLINKISTLFY